MGLAWAKDSPRATLSASSDPGIVPSFSAGVILISTSSESELEEFPGDRMSDKDMYLLLLSPFSPGRLTRTIPVQRNEKEARGRGLADLQEPLRIVSGTPALSGCR